jgi:hypothetical protein
MLNNFQKFTISLIIFCLVFGLVFNVAIFKAKQAKALDGGGSWAVAIKEIALDAVGWAVADQILKPLKQKIIDWGMGRQTDSNEPFFVLDWKKFFNEIRDVASAKLVQKLRATKLCQPFSIDVALPLPLSQFGVYYSDRPTFEQYGACTIIDIIGEGGTIEQFFKNPSINIYGWDAWTALARPNNNYLGAYYLMEEEEERLQDEEAQAKDKETAVSQGTKNETTTKQTDTEACQQNCGRRDFCDEGNMDNFNEEYCDACMAECETTTKGLALVETVKNLGKDINTSLNNAMSADMQRIISADEISELLGIFFSSVLNKAIDGLGLIPSTANSSARSVNRDDYGYQKSIDKTLTPEMKANAYTQVLTGTLKGVQMIARSTTNCKDEDEMMNDLEFAKNIHDIYSAELEALYVGITGIGIKPDFEVLDPLYAPFTVNGSGWGAIPANKIPKKCRSIIDQLGLGANATCKNIHSGLEPNYNAKCTDCLYDGNEWNCPPEPVPPLSEVVTLPGGVKITKPIILTEEQIQAKQNFYNSCLQWYEPLTTRCNDCLEKADAKCNQDDPGQKEACIEQVCDNYDDLKTHVVSTISSGLDFYNKCLIEETKNSCFSCLKEYFMPASYCSTMTDFTARALIKYPAVLLRVSDDDGHSVGRYDPTFIEAYGNSATECDNDSNVNGPIELDLICRIMPDFTYGGVKVCRQYCMGNGMTEEQLNDITDWRPSGADCNKKYLNIGGKINVWEIIKSGIYNQKGKCCAAEWQNDYGKYERCVGSSPQQQEPPPEIPFCYGKTIQEYPECFCDTGWQPIGIAGTGWTTIDRGSLRGDCMNFDFTYTGQELYGESNTAPGGSTAFIGTGICSEVQENVDNGCPTSIGAIEPYTNGNTDATPPSGMIWHEETEDKKNIFPADLNKPEDGGWCDGAGAYSRWDNIPTSGLNAGSTYYGGVYHDENNDGPTSFTLCSRCSEMPCDGAPGENKCPYYGTNKNRCAKVDYNTGQPI